MISRSEVRAIRAQWKIGPEDFEYLEKAKHYGRRRDPSTSHAAGWNITDERGGYHFAIWVAIRAIRPCTAKMVVAYLERINALSSRSGTRTRIKKLELEGWIKYTGKKKNGSRLMRSSVPDWKKVDLEFEEDQLSFIQEGSGV